MGEKCENSQQGQGVDKTEPPFITPLPFQDGEKLIIREPPSGKSISPSAGQLIETLRAKSNLLAINLFDLTSGDIEIINSRSITY